MGAFPKYLACIFLLVSCSKTFRGEAVQPNPMAQPLDTLRLSERITIVTGDMDLEVPDQPEPTQQATPVRNNKYPLINSAYFVIVSRDRLRFHVQVDHKWPDWADLKNWKAELVDDAGRHWLPESVDRHNVKLMTTMWDREQRTAVRNRYGDVVQLNQDGWQNRQTLGSLSVYRGRADLSFYQRDLFHAGVRWLRLTVRRDGLAFVFLWRFQDNPVSE